MAIVSVRVETKNDRIERERAEWICECVAHLYKEGIYDCSVFSEVMMALDFAEIAYESVMEADGSIDKDCDVATVVAEEISYWSE